MTDEVDHVHMECVWCGMLWKEVKVPPSFAHSYRRAVQIKNQCPRCGGMGAETTPR